MLVSLRKFDSSDVAQQRMKIINFYNQYGEKATKQAFGADRFVVSRWKRRLRKSGGKLTSLVPLSTKPKNVRIPTTHSKVIEFIKKQREDHPRIGKEKIKPDLDLHCEKLGIHRVSFTGDDFGGDTERTYGIADEIIRRGIRMEWFVTTRADHIFERKNTLEQNARLRQIMQHCVEAGLTRVFLGLESGSQSQLKRYGKQITVEENFKAIEILRELGIDVVAGYIPIDYLMTVVELRETLEFLEKTGMGLKVSNPLSVLRVQVGSPYLKLVEHAGLLGEQTEDLVFYKAHFKDPRIELVAQIADRWVEDLYPLIYGLKGEVASMTTLSREDQQSPARNLEATLHAFRRLELDFLKSLVTELEKSERIDNPAINIIKESFVGKRRSLLAWVEEQLLSGNYGGVQTSRLLTCFKEITQ